MQHDNFSFKHHFFSSILQNPEKLMNCSDINFSIKYQSRHLKKYKSCNQKISLMQICLSTDNLRLYIIVFLNDENNMDGMYCRCSDEVNPRAKPYKFTNQKLKDLGLEFTPVKQCLYETVKSLQEKGHLPLPVQHDQEAIRIQ